MSIQSPCKTCPQRLFEGITPCTVIEPGSLLPTNPDLSPIEEKLKELLNSSNRIKELETQLKEAEGMILNQGETIEKLIKQNEIMREALESCKSLVDDEAVQTESDNEEKEFWVSHNSLEFIVDDALQQCAEIEGEK